MTAAHDPTVSPSPTVRGTTSGAIPITGSGTSTGGDGPALTGSLAWATWALFVGLAVLSLLWTPYPATELDIHAARRAIRIQAPREGQPVDRGSRRPGRWRGLSRWRLTSVGA